MRIIDSNTSGTNQNEIKGSEPDFYVSTTQAEHTWQPIEKINLDDTYHKKKNEFSLYVDATFQGGVFKMPFIDPPRKSIGGVDVEKSYEYHNIIQ